MLTILTVGLSWLTSAWRWLRTGGHWKPVAIAVTAITLALYIQHAHRVSAKLDATKEALAVSKGEVVLLDRARVSDSAAYQGNLIAKTAIANTEVTASVETEKALAANPEWASQPIPADIVTSLRE